MNDFERSRQVWKETLKQDRRKAKELYYADVFPEVVARFTNANNGLERYRFLISLLGFSPEPVILFINAINPERVRFLYIAKGSCGEVRSHLYATLDQSYISKEDFDSAAPQAIETSRLLHYLIEYLKGSHMKGAKFKKPPVKSFREEVQEFFRQYNATKD